MNRSSFRWPLFQRFLAISCLILLIPFTVASLIVLGLIPVYLSNHAVSVIRTTISPPFNVSYVLMDEARKGPINMGTIDRNKLARSFERGLQLKVPNIIQVNHVSSDRAGRSRRKRAAQCNRDGDKPLLTFNFNLTYPINRMCQTQKCVDETFAEVYQQFQDVPSMAVEINNVERELQLCSFSTPSSVTAGTTDSNSNSNPDLNSNATANSSSSSNPSEVMTTSIPNEKNSSSLTTPTSNIQTTSIPNADNSSFPTTSASDIRTTSIPNGDNSSSPTASASDIQTTTTSIENSNETDIVTFENCLAKQPFTQETVPPFRINHTNALIYRGIHSFLIVGPSKIQTFIVNKQIQRETYIDEVLVDKDCQRTWALDLPYVLFSALPL